MVTQDNPPPRAQSRSVLIVDDEESFRDVMGERFAFFGFRVMTAPTYEEGMALATQTPPDKALIDLRLPDRNGLYLIRDLRALDPSIKSLLMTAYPSRAVTRDAIRLGA